MRLNLDLAAQLMLNACFLQLRLEENLQSHDVLGRFLTSQVHISKLATPERFANVEIAELPLLLAAGRFPESGRAGTCRSRIRSFAVV